MRSLISATVLLSSALFVAGPAAAQSVGETISECPPNADSPFVGISGLVRAAAPIAPAVGATCLGSRADFEKFAKRDNVPGAMNVREMKFLMVGVDTPNPQIYFINTNNFDYHYDFYSRGLGNTLSLEEFNRQTYFTDRRKNIAGSIIAHDNYGAKGAYAVEFWPTDPVKAEHAAMAWKAIAGCMAFSQGPVAYHPAGETQIELFEQEKAKFAALGVKTLTTEDLFGNVAYSSLNPGEGYGLLRVADGDPRPPTVRDVVIFKNAPNDLPHVGGVITEQPQTPLSHINLKAKQDHTPNAYIKDASNDPRLKPLLGKIVHYKVTADGFEIEEATQAEADAYFEKLRPTTVTHSNRNLRVKTIRPLRNLSNSNSTAYGAKAANVAELAKILPDEVVPDGFGVPFSFYDDYMKANGFYAEADRMMSDPRFKSDPIVREQMLNDFKRKIRRGTMPPALHAKLADMYRQFPAGTAVRCRSSTNNEDLADFNGAGLYDSYTHRPDEGDIDRTIQQVWGSLWNFRAFEEREFYRIDHKSTAMAVLVHPNTDDEMSNGVAVTKNIYDPNWPGFYVNVQKGENLVTNPTEGATPDEYLVSAIGENGEFETQYVRHSNQVPKGETILTPAQRDQLKDAMDKIQDHFAKVYHREGDKTFGMDIEFKFNKDGQLIIKQARPYLD